VKTAGSISREKPGENEGLMDKDNIPIFLCFKKGLTVWMGKEKKGNVKGYKDDGYFGVSTHTCLKIVL
jgi:hypothetical protein